MFSNTKPLESRKQHTQNIYSFPIATNVIPNDEKSRPPGRAPQPRLHAAAQGRGPPRQPDHPVPPRARRQPPAQLQRGPLDPPVRHPVAGPGPHQLRLRAAPRGAGQTPGARGRSERQAEQGRRHGLPQDTAARRPGGGQAVREARRAIRDGEEGQGREAACGQEQGSGRARADRQAPGRREDVRRGECEASFSFIFYIMLYSCFTYFSGCIRCVQLYIFSNLN